MQTGNCSFNDGKCFLLLIWNEIEIFKYLINVIAMLLLLGYGKECLISSLLVLLILRIKNTI